MANKLIIPLQVHHNVIPGKLKSPEVVTAFSQLDKQLSSLKPTSHEIGQYNQYQSLSSFGKWWYRWKPSWIGRNKIDISKVEQKTKEYNTITPIYYKTLTNLVHIYNLKYQSCSNDPQKATDIKAHFHASIKLTKNSIVAKHPNYSSVPSFLNLLDKIKEKISTNFDKVNENHHSKQKVFFKSTQAELSLESAKFETKTTVQSTAYSTGLFKTPSQAIDIAKSKIGDSQFKI